MKRISLIFAIIPLTALTLFAGHVDSETARKVATTFLNNNGAKTDQLTDLSKEAGFSNLYIFNGNPGFVVMAADDCVQPILGYSLTGTFKVDGMPENIKYWLQGYSDEIQHAVDHQIKATVETTQLWNSLLYNKSNTATTATPVAGPLIQTKWGQGSPYNNLCPSNSLTGCVATAMAQVAKYWNYPTRGIGSHSYQYQSYGNIAADFGAITYDWGNMTDTYSSTSTSAQNEAVATLMYHCGVMVEMQYGPSESGSNITRSSIGMATYFNYNTSYLEKKDYLDKKWSDTLKYELNNNRPILYAGNGTGGHAFVCDGYDSDGNFHFNWGWSGNNDGYFPLSALKPGSYNFSEGQLAVISIYPLTNATTPLSLGNDQTSLTWTDSQNCSSYNIYRNDALIATTTERTYTDPNPFYGANKYYVRGQAGTVLSLPSNYATVNIDYPTPIANHLQAETSDDNIVLSWEAPEWCFPSIADGTTFSYVDEERQTNNDSRYTWPEGDFVLSWGHRYPAEILTNYNGKVIHEISFFSMYPGAFDVVVYQETMDDKPVTEIVRESITTSRIGWSRVGLRTPVIVDSNQDLWIFISNTDCKVHTIYNNNVTGNINGCYYSNLDPTVACGHDSENNIVWMICAYLTDGTYTYNLYDGTTKVNGDVPITSTNYTINNLADGVHQFTVKTNYYGNESEASNMAGLTLGTAPALETLKLGSGNVMTVASGSTLTVTGTLTNDDPANLVIENGSQLFYSSNTKATVKKSITGYGTSDNQSGWYLIASPLTDQLNIAEGTNLTNAGDFDLYIFDQTNNKEWLNYKQNHFTTIENKKGYLYANKNGIDIEFSGTVNNTSGSVDLTYSSGYTFSGYNLVGNPYPCNATISREYYRIVETSEGSKLQLASSAIAPMEGILVKSTGTSDNNIIFTKESGSKEDNDTKAMIKLTITKGQDDILDKACIHFDGDYNMEKITFRDAGTQLYLTQNGKQYALLVIDQQTEVPISFKASTDGEYTLTVTAPLTSHLSTLNFKSLHLVDNLTGADIDLLQNPSYNFEAKANDYAARFKLVFNTEANNDTYGEDFVEGKTTIIDMTGRVVATDRNTQLAPGVYIIRTVNGNETNSKKIIINK
ncbi:MAG: thiol protease/hemagglutinin PrtT [Bacteroidales bacterium]|nr:thiol protease/hemagglutinin PrtT [Bacteroidales bacterium]